MSTANLIDAHAEWGNTPGVDVLDESRTDDIRELLLGHSVRKVADDHLLLDDGTMLRIIPNSGCICGSGDYGLAELNDCPNVITSVEVVDEELDEADEWGGRDSHAYRIFVFAGDKRINLLSVEGDDGNGYYGTGYRLLVRKATTAEESA